MHVSVDASGSMVGIKWYKTLTVLVAICKAASMIDNLNISVSFRTSVRARTNTEIPYILIAYDSKKDKFSKILTHFKYLCPGNTTPEGLTYEALLDVLPVKSPEEDLFFLNISDGVPWFETICDDGFKLLYRDQVSVKHTKNQVKKIREKGYEILSYFINSGEDENINSNPKQFREMYGKNSVFIDVNNITEICKTMNALFLKKTS
jgi:hypothetical protein